MYKIKTYNLKINDEHEAVSVECPTHIRRGEKENRLGSYDIATTEGVNYIHKCPKSDGA